METENSRITTMIQPARSNPLPYFRLALPKEYYLHAIGHFIMSFAALVSTTRKLNKEERGCGISMT